MKIKYRCKVPGFGNFFFLPSNMGTLKVYNAANTVYTALLRNVRIPSLREYLKL